MVQLSHLGLVAVMLGACPSEALAQILHYSEGDYRYAEQRDEDSQLPEDGVEGTEMRPHGSDVRPIPSIEPDDHADTDSDTPPPWPERESIDANVVPSGRGFVRLVERSTLPEGTIVYAYPGYFGGATGSSGAMHMIYRMHPVASRNSDYIQYEADSPVPAGGRLVHFDPEMWLDECSRRIAPQPEDHESASRRRHHRPMEPAVEDNSRQQCQAYLDDYMRSARSGGLHGLNSESGQYMLVPVTVLVPQRAVFGDGTPVRR